MLHAMLMANLDGAHMCFQSKSGAAGLNDPGACGVVAIVSVLCDAVRNCLGDAACSQNPF